MSNMNMSELLKEYVEATVRKLVDSPDEVDINIMISTKSVIVQIKVAKQDTGKVIGKRGRTIESLKVIVLAIKNTHFSEDSRRVSLEILEEEDANHTFNNKEEE